MKIENIFYQNDQQKKLDKIGFVNKVSDIFVFFSLIIYTNTLSNFDCNRYCFQNFFMQQYLRGSYDVLEKLNRLAKT